METHFKTPQVNQSGSDSELQLVFKEGKKEDKPTTSSSQKPLSPYDSTRRNT